MDPMTGPDAPTYNSVLETYVKNGPLAAHPSVPFWQPGYPWFLYLLHQLSPMNDLHFLMAIQSLCLSVSALLMQRVISKLFNASSGFVVGLLICMNPAFFGASSQLMYEIPQMMFIVIIIYLYIFSSLKLLKLVVLSNVILGISVFFALSMQPKSLPILMILAIIYRGQTRSAPLMLSISIAGTFATLLARNLYTGAGFLISSNFSTHIRLGTRNAITLRDNCDKFGFDNPQKILCLQASRFENPTKGIEAMLHNLFDLFAPFIGPYGYGGNSGTGTWWHSFDIRRILPFTIKDNDFLYSLDKALSLIWIITYILIVMIAPFYLMRINVDGRKLFLFIYLSTLVSIVIVCLGYGDSRYRLGFSFLLIPIMVELTRNIFARLRHNSMTS